MAIIHKRLPDKVSQMPEIDGESVELFNVLLLILQFTFGLLLYKNVASNPSIYP